MYHLKDILERSTAFEMVQEALERDILECIWCNGPPNPELLDYAFSFSVTGRANI